MSHNPTPEPTTTLMPYALTLPLTLRWVVGLCVTHPSPDMRWAVCDSPPLRVPLCLKTHPMRPDDLQRPELRPLLGHVQGQHAGTASACELSPALCVC